MHSGTKKRRVKFTLISMIAAFTFSLVLFMGAAQTFDREMVLLSALTGAAIGLPAFVVWSVIMKTKETKFRGAWCGMLTVILAYPVLAILMAILDTSSMGVFDYIVFTIIFGITLTGIFTIPIGGFLGHVIAKNVDVKNEN